MNDGEICLETQEDFCQKRRTRTIQAARRPEANFGDLMSEFACRTRGLGFTRHKGPDGNSASHATLRGAAYSNLRTHEQAGGSAGKSVRHQLRRSGTWSLAAMLLALAGCTTYRTEPPQITSHVPFLASLHPGTTTRQELKQDWGQPSATLQHGRIEFYRLEGNGNSLRFSEETGDWKRSRHSLVLIFNPNGGLEKSSLVRIR